MPDTQRPPIRPDTESLRRRLAELTEENAHLRGRGPASRGSIELLGENVELRRRVEHLRQRLPVADLGATSAAYLTIHQVASRLNATAADASRLLAKVETRTDRNGVQVVAVDRFEQFILDTAGGRNPSRFL